MKIAVGCDHGGYGLKAALADWLKTQGHEIIDFGCFSEESVDYPPIAAKAARAVVAGQADRGLLICSTGIGISICANKVPGARAALCTDAHQAEMTRRHNDANILCLGGHVVTKEQGQEIAGVFLTTDFEGERHRRRVDMIADVEKGLL